MIGANCRDRRGATLPLIGLLLVVLLGMVAFTFEVGRICLVRTEIQSAVDAGALAAALKLRQNAQAVEEAAAAARDFVSRNEIGWTAMSVDDAVNVQVGKWNSDTRTFVATASSPNAVRVSARQESEPFMFARVLGQQTFTAEMSATAAANGEPLDIIMALDLSGSMSSNGRIEALRNAAPVFVDVIESFHADDRIGVMGYGAIISQFDPLQHGSGLPYASAPLALYPASDDWAAVLEAHLTDDFGHLRSSVLTSDSLLSGKYHGWTPTGAAIRDAAHYLTVHARSNVRKVVVLMSDGHANRPAGNGRGYARDMADYANGHQIKVYTISLGNSADEALMEDIAERTGAEHFDATGSGRDELTAALTAAFRHVALAIKRTQLVE